MLGQYTITYTSTDASGNEGTATRTVNVTDTTAPVFTSSSTYYAEFGGKGIGTAAGAAGVGKPAATELQAVTFAVIDAAWSDGSQHSDSEIKIETGNILVLANASNQPGVINATLSATDSSGNVATQDITVNVTDLSLIHI